MDTIVIVGASLAGLRAAEALRSEGFDRRHPDRRGRGPPPVRSPAPLQADPVRRVAARPDRAPARSGRRLGCRPPLATWATGLDPDAEGGHHHRAATWTYDGCVLATGSIVRTLPGQPDLAGIHTLRTIDDALALRAELDASPSRVVVIGAGFIGAEVAATARGRGLEVTILEGLPGAPAARSR